MRLKSITLLALISLLSASTVPLLPAFSIKPLLAQMSANPQAEAYLLVQQGIQQYNNSQFNDALESWLQALTIYQTIGNRAEEASSLINVGVAYHALGQYQKVIESYEQSLAITREINNRAKEANALIKLGLAYHALGQYQKVIEFYEQSLAITREINDRAGEAYVLAKLGLAYSDLEQYQKAFELYEQSLAIAREIDAQTEEAIVLNNLQLAYKFLEPQELIKLYEQSLTIARETENRTREAYALTHLGSAYFQLGEYHKAITFEEKSLAIAREIGSRQAEAASLNTIGAAYYNLEQYTDASIRLLKAIEVYESLRPELTDANKVSIFDTQTDVYRNLQQTLVALNKTNQALEIAERGRARAFVELLASRISDNSNQVLQGTINPISTEPLTTKQIQQIARQQKATLVEYSIVFNSLYIWVVKPTGEIAFKQVELKGKSLEKLVKKTRKSIGARARDSKEVLDRKANGLRQLHDLLIQPIAQLLPTNPEERIIFIPQESLFLAPFPALLDKNDKYLIEKHTIQTAPSIQVLDLTHKRRPQVPGNASEVLVVGNPTMPKIATNWEKLPRQLTSLPGAEREAQEIAQIHNTAPLIGDKASKVTIMQKMPNARIIHLATHGLLDHFLVHKRINEGKSAWLEALEAPGAIALAPTQTDDGLLTAPEIAPLNLKAELVVLSACNTGRGKLTGDGVIGLSRSFITAGVPSVLVSLWRVPDYATATLMIDFYTNLEEGKLDKAQALRQAMLTMLEKKRDPNNWASFTLIGEAE
ncbi:MAG: CHAT domain-containing protein [Symploca sp. SIO3C6]|nr:CHAT domain-containing protein [Symploca sp. SIO3C6]